MRILDKLPLICLLSVMMLPLSMVLGCGFSWIDGTLGDSTELALNCWRASTLLLTLQSVIFFIVLVLITNHSE